MSDPEQITTVGEPNASHRVRELCEAVLDPISDSGGAEIALASAVLSILDDYDIAPASRPDRPVGPDEAHIITVKPGAARATCSCGELPSHCPKATWPATPPVGVSTEQVERGVVAILAESFGMGRAMTMYPNLTEETRTMLETRVLTIAAALGLPVDAALGVPTDERGE